MSTFTSPMYSRNYKSRKNTSAAQALSGALQSARRGRGAPKREQRTGRIDARRLSRIGIGDLRVFTRRNDPAPQKIRVTILVDASASMSGIVANMAQQICRDLAEATDMLPWVTADVVGFTTGASCVMLYPVWKTGMDPKRVDDYDFIPMNGTMEGYAIAFALDEMSEKITADEQGLIIIVSDGGPSEPQHVKAVVKHCWESKVPVVSVALNHSASQPIMYGKDNVIHFTQGNTKKLARDMARAIGKVL